MTEGHCKGILQIEEGNPAQLQSIPAPAKLFENKLFDELMAVAPPRAAGTTAQCDTSGCTPTRLPVHHGKDLVAEVLMTNCFATRSRRSWEAGQHTLMPVLSLQSLQRQEEALGPLSRFGEQQIPLYCVSHQKKGRLVTQLVTSALLLLFKGLERLHRGIRLMPYKRLDKRCWLRVNACTQPGEKDECS